MHGACFDIYLSSPDQKIREVSRARIIQTCQIAKELKLGRIVFHTNYLPTVMFNPYIDNWLIENQLFWIEIIKEFDLKILIENSFDQDPELILRLIEAVNSDNIGICLDIGHCNLSKTSIKNWIEKLKDHIIQLHINDNNGILDRHLAVGDGIINWEDVSNLISLNRLEPIIVFEMYTLSDIRRSIEFINKKDLFSF